MEMEDDACMSTAIEKKKKTGFIIWLYFRLVKLSFFCIAFLINLLSDFFVFRFLPFV